MARQPIKRQAPGGTIHMGLWWIVGILVLSGAATVALPSVILLVLGLLPSWIAFVVDRNVGKVAGKCVLAMNLVGVAPYPLNQWVVGGAGQADAAFAALSDPYSWAVMYGAASLGWLLYFGVPHVRRAGRGNARHATERKACQASGRADRGMGRGDRGRPATAEAENLSFLLPEAGGVRWVTRESVVR